jgi:hypothetical protein
VPTLAAVHGACGGGFIAVLCPFVGKEDFTLNALLEAKAIVIFREYFVRIVTKSQECFCAEPPREGREFVAHGVGDRVYRDEASALGEVQPFLRCVKRTFPAQIRILARI